MSVFPSNIKYFVMFVIVKRISLLRQISTKYCTESGVMFFCKFGREGYKTVCVAVAAMNLLHIFASKFEHVLCSINAKKEKKKYSVYML
jgi:hypothetical protein